MCVIIGEHLLNTAALFSSGKPLIKSVEATVAHFHNLFDPSDTESIMFRTSSSREPDDVEWRAADRGSNGVTQPPLHPETSNNKRKRQSSCFCAPQMFGGGIFLPDPSTYDPLEILLNTHDESERNELVEKWRDNKLSELNFVGVVVCTATIDDAAPLTTVKSALLAGVLTSTGSWPNILTTGRPTPWYVRTSWYCGIIITMLSIISAADQTVRLHRLSSHRDGIANLHKLLGKGSRWKRTGRRAPNLVQVLTWQMPVMFLISATICMVVGMFLLVWSATSNLGNSGGLDDGDKV
ncbi:hypothetical protein J4E93_010623 [Alternaria ventricosa]|uniref:uncharacterized protein n=1 Tax=Alternaria ventricosa TaxID=1187951 RepID=UPI0020C2AF79|nr:uncharacterized protein J4E93_010623 [Alternaria ventricosa]KAI4637107.1 hypothetical protein J4E93_010623 [Alternaria ventricosa]